MKNNKRMAMCIVLLLSAGMLTGCTTAGNYSSRYFEHIGTKIATLKGQTEAGDLSGSRDDGKTRLPGPANFTLSADGKFSFDTVENADNYIITLYDKDTGEGSYSSDVIKGKGSSISGNLADYGTYGYGNFRAEVVAYPSMGNTEYKKSNASTCEVSIGGEVPEVEVTYRWDCFTKTLGVQLSNASVYEASAYPTRVTVTFTNTANASDIIKFVLEDISLEGTIQDETEAVTADASYNVKVAAEFPKIVTNAFQEVELDMLNTDSKASVILDGYAYSLTNVYSYAEFPTAADVDPVAGGSIGTTYAFTATSTSDKGIVTPASFDGDTIFYTAVPAETVTEGSTYSFTVKMQNQDGKLVNSGGWGGSTVMEPGIGTLELLSDGTFRMEITGSENAGEEVEQGQSQGPQMGGGSTGVSASVIEGLWKLNENGMIHLSYDLSSAKSTAQGGGGFPPS